MSKTVCLFGKGSLAVRIADYLLQSPKFNLIGVVPVKLEPKWTISLSEWAIERNIPILSLNEIQQKEMRVNIGFSCFFDEIFTEEQISLFDLALNLHNSPLPKYRGVNPVNWTLKNNEEFHGLTIHEITTGIDDGPIFGQVKFSINPHIDEVEDVYKRALNFGFTLFEDTISQLETIEPRIQLESEASYYSKKDFEKLGDRKYIRRDSVS